MISPTPFKSTIACAILFLCTSAMAAQSSEVLARQASEHLKPEPAASAPQVVLTDAEVPDYLVTQHTYDFLLWSLAAGHDTWVSYALGPIGAEAGTPAEAALETFLLRARDTVTRDLHVAYDAEQERARFQRDQLDFRLQKMAQMAVVHAEMIRLLEDLGVGAHGLLEFMEEKIRPGVTVAMTPAADKTGADMRVQQDAIFSFYKAAFVAAREGSELPSPDLRLHKSGSSGDVLSLSGSALFPNCGEGLVGRRGWHSLQLVTKDRATNLQLTGQLKECGWIFDDFVGTHCTVLQAATASGQTISCTSTASDTVCRHMNEHRAWQQYYVQRNGLPALLSSNQSQCTKPNRCDDFPPAW